MRDVFQYRPKITRDQFLTIGFAECKVILTVDFLKNCQKKHTELSGQTKTTTTSTKNYLNKRKNSASSFATVHTVAESSGISSVWQEKVISDSSPKPHLPLSPPASPLQSPYIDEGPTIIPEPVLELTPVSTPIKTSLSSASQNSGFSSLVNDYTLTSLDKEVDIVGDLESCACDNIEIVTVESEEKLLDICHSEESDWPRRGGDLVEEEQFLPMVSHIIIHRLLCVCVCVCV